MARAQLIKTLFISLICALAIGFSSLLYFSYQDYVNPEHVYSRWIEIGSPKYNTEVLTLNDKGVFRNGRLIATSFEYDGEKIYITTGDGTSIYQVTGTFDSPQLKRIQPNSPSQQFVKEGFEGTIDLEGGSAANRRAALSNHFDEE